MNFSQPHQLAQVQELFDKVAKVCKFDAKSIAAQRSFNLFHYGRLKVLLAAHNYLEQGNGFLALFELNWVVEDTRLISAKAEETVDAIYGLEQKPGGR